MGRPIVGKRSGERNLNLSSADPWKQNSGFTELDWQAIPLDPHADRSAVHKILADYEAGFVEMVMNFRSRISATGERSTNSNP